MSPYLREVSTELHNKALLSKGPTSTMKEKNTGKIPQPPGLSAVRHLPWPSLVDLWIIALNDREDHKRYSSLAILPENSLSLSLLSSLLPLLHLGLFEYIVLAEE